MSVCPSVRLSVSFSHNFKDVIVLFSFVKFLCLKKVILGAKPFLVLFLKFLNSNNRLYFVRLSACPLVSLDLNLKHFV